LFFTSIFNLHLLEGIFESRVLSIQDFKLSYLGLLYTWSQVLVGGFNLSLLDFVDKIMHESLRAWCFCICLFCKWVSPLWCLFNIFLWLLIKKKVYSTCTCSYLMQVVCSLQAYSTCTCSYLIQTAPTCFNLLLPVSTCFNLRTATQTCPKMPFQLLSELIT